MVEPFFTTKPVGHGTGLGSSQVYAVARESRGSLHIDSEVHQGTTVCLILLLALADAILPPMPTPAASVARKRSSSQQANASVSVVDDRLVRRFMTESLRSLGYEARTRIMASMR